MKLRTLKPRIQAANTSRLQPAPSGSWRSEKSSSTQRGYGYKWQQARAAYLIKHPFCVYCLRNAGVVATDVAEIIVECIGKGMQLPHASVVDHSVPHRGDMVIFWDSSRWQSLCATHHSRDKQREELYSA